MEWAQAWWDGENWLKESYRVMYDARRRQKPKTNGGWCHKNVQLLLTFQDGGWPCFTAFRGIRSKCYLISFAQPWICEGQLERFFFCCWSCWILNLVGSVKTMWNHTTLEMMKDPGQQDWILFEPFVVSYHVLFWLEKCPYKALHPHQTGDIFYMPPLSIRHPFCVHLISMWGQTAFW